MVHHYEDDHEDKNRWADDVDNSRVSNEHRICLLEREFGDVIKSICLG